LAWYILGQVLKVSSALNDHGRGLDIGEAFCFEIGFEDFGRKLRYDAIPCNAPEINASGHPINQQAKTGFGAPRFAVVASDPFVIGPVKPM
jgi:hypothetical protein